LVFGLQQALEKSIDTAVAVGENEPHSIPNEKRTTAAITHASNGWKS
jgi:hypothetical protein